MLSYVNQNDRFFINVLNENLTDIEKVNPANIGYGLDVIGSPKSNIRVGCTQPSQLSYIESLLTPVYVNGRWINFNIESFNIDEDIPDYLDAVIFIDYSAEYTTHKSKIQDYLDKGGTVIGINAFIDNQDFLDIFGLTEV